MVAQANLVDITQRVDMKQEPPTTDAPTRRGSKSRQAPRGSEMPSLEQQSQPSGWNLATIKEGDKRAKPEAPKFLLLLYEILEVENSRVIRWSEDGLALQILDPVTVTEQILPKYFNHTNFHSFQRQLNYFGFRKWTKSKTDICTFSHPFFRENQPHMLQLIKRKKAPRRTPASSINSSAPATASGSTSKKLSPSGKRKRPSNEAHSEDFSTQSTEMHIQMNSSSVAIQPSVNGMSLSAMTTPHGASSSGNLCFSHDGLTRQYLPELNNVISPVAATECKKKAKKLDKKDYLATAAMHGPLASPTDASNAFVATSTVPSLSGFMPSSSMSASSSNNVSRCTSSRASSEGGSSSHMNGYAAPATATSTALPTLNIVRNRLIQRQQANGPEQQQQLVLQQQQQYDYKGFTSFGASNGAQGMGVPAMENHPERTVQSMAMVQASRAELNPGQSPVFSNSFSDPVNILLRIKKSRTSSGEGKDVGTKQEQADDQNENLASLHNYLLTNSLHTNRLQAQLKLFAEENEALKHMLDSKQREVDTLQGQRKVLQQENAVLLEDKNKLFEINRDLLSKLFPQ